jgi:hypothetical protein
MPFKLKKFDTQKELFNYVVENEEYILEEKKAEMKKADGFDFTIVSNKTIKTNKEQNLLDKEEINVTIVINTTKLMDSHMDVHIDGMWDKSLLENKRIKHLQEHVRSFDHIISDKEDLKAYVKTYTWKELGYDVEGKTQALVFESKVKKSRNPYMHEQYAKGNVDNHSVGMQYVKLLTCINDEDYPVQKENWDKYYPMIVNNEVADKAGIFWAVLEAKCIEGSAVVDGSNPITPTLSTKDKNITLDSNKKYLEAVKNWLAS